MQDMTNCTSCGSNDISLDINLSKLKCNQCGQIYENVEMSNKFEDIDKLNNISISGGALDIAESNSNLVIYKCDICNTEIVTSELNNNVICPTCHKKLEINNRASGELNVRYILPFRINKDNAVNKMNEYMKINSKFINNNFEKKYNADNIVACFIPFTLFDIDYNCTFEGQAERKIDSIYDSDSGTTYYYDGYDIIRGFEVDAKHLSLETKSNSFTDKESAYSNMISALNPYDTNELIELKEKYLRDTVAEILTYKRLEYDDRFKNKLISIGKYAILDNLIYYDRGIKWNKTDLEIKSINCYDAYLPVWLYYFNDAKEIHYIAINGRTGELAVHVPFDKKKAIIKSIVEPVIVAAVFDFFMGLLLIPIFSIPGKLENNNAIFEKVPYIILGAITLTILIGGFIKTYQGIKMSCLGNHEVGENDSKAIFKTNITNKIDNKTCTNKKSSMSVINGRNDNSDERRRERFKKSVNYKVVK